MQSPILQMLRNGQVLISPSSQIYVPLHWFLLIFRLCRLWCMMYRKQDMQWSPIFSLIPISNEKCGIRILVRPWPFEELNINKMSKLAELSAILPSIKLHVLKIWNSNQFHLVILASVSDNNMPVHDFEFVDWKIGQGCTFVLLARRFKWT